MGRLRCRFSAPCVTRRYWQGEGYGKREGSDISTAWFPLPSPLDAS